MGSLATALADAGGVAAPRERGAQLRTLLRDELARSERELSLPRSGRDQPVVVGFAAAPDALIAVLPVPAALRADPQSAPERGLLATAAAIGALVDSAGLRAPQHAADLVLEAGALDGHLALRVPVAATGADDAELAVVAFEEHAAAIARLRSQALALPAHAIGEAHDWRAPIAQALRSAEAIARLGGRPADHDAAAELEDAVLAIVAPRARGVSLPHDDPDPARRIARRILLRLHGMGKWGAFHTEFRHLARGYAGNERALAHAIGEALVDSGLLAQKPSVGQRHVFLNPRRAADIHALVERGEVPPDLRLP